MRLLIDPIDDLLNSITTYRLLLYGLLLLLGVTIVFSFTGTLAYSPASLLLPVGLLISVCYLSNRLLAGLYNVVPNTESSLVTALIMFFVLAPTTAPSTLMATALAGLVAMASKYVLAPWSKHLFNPSAFGAVVVGLLGIASATWWVGSLVLLPFTGLLGLIILRKTRRFLLFAPFAATALIITAAFSIRDGVDPLVTIPLAIASGPLVFLGSIMLTEPATIPPTRNLRLWYGALVGLLLTIPAHFGPVYMTPALALITGNAFAFIVSPKRRHQLELVTKTKIASNSWDFAFKSASPFSFSPGQYLEWTLPVRNTDSRGNRRTFTIASSPTEDHIHLGVKFYQPSSRFKTTLASLKPGDTVLAGQLAGDFTLPKNPDLPLVFIAGGIGITPFRSMIKYLIDTRQQRDIVLFYGVNRPDELAYKDIVEAGAASGVRLILLLDRFLTTETLKKELPDFAGRRYYISGPNIMVTNYKRLLQNSGIPRRYIHTDYFSGY